MMVSVGIQIVFATEARGPPGEHTKPINDKMGVQRHPDIAKDSEGRLHMVWQEPVDGQYEIFYAAQSGQKKEMGIGTEVNPDYQLSDTPTDSHHPKISIDPATDIIYVIWTEDHEDGIHDTAGTSFSGQSLMYTAAVFEPNSEPLWTEVQNLADGSEPVKSFSVQSSEFDIRGGTSTKVLLNGIMDTDRDKISDSDEVLGVLGYQTSWFKEDTDDDTMIDSIEIVEGFNPLVNNLILGDKNFLRVLFLFSDVDGDGLRFYEEGTCDFPITARVANVLNTGYVEYTFFPKADHSASLVLDLQIKRLGALMIPPPVTASYTIVVTVQSATLGSVTFSHTGSALEWDRFQTSAGSFNVFEQEETTVRINVSVPQPNGPDYRTLAFSSVMIAAPSPDFDLFNYKEGRDYGDSYLAGVLTEHFEICGDRNRPDLFIEFDYLVGHEPSHELFSEVINAYSDSGIKLHYKIDQMNIPLGTATTPDADGDGAEVLRNDAEYLDLLDSTRNSAYSRYIHMVFANTMVHDDLPGYTLYGGAISAPTAGDLTHSGILIADQALVDTVTTASTLMERRLKVFVHEVGHALGASHEGPNSPTPAGTYNALVDGPGGTDTFNGYNVMRQGGLTSFGAAGQLLRGVGNTDRNMGATSDIGRPRFSIESLPQLDMTNKLSVDTGRNIDILNQFV
jgi:hypothetical protein